MPKSLIEKAKDVLYSKELPDLKGAGLCYLFGEQGEVGMRLPLFIMTDLIGEYKRSSFTGGMWLGSAGVWNDHRLNVVCLLACLDEEDLS